MTTTGRPGGAPGSAPARAPGPGRRGRGTTCRPRSEPDTTSSGASTSRATSVGDHPLAAVEQRGIGRLVRGQALVRAGPHVRRRRAGDGAGAVSAGSWARTAASTARSRAGSAPSSSASTRRARCAAASASPCRPQRYSATTSSRHHSSCSGSSATSRSTLRRRPRRARRGRAGPPAAPSRAGADLGQPPSLGVGERRVRPVAVRLTPPQAERRESSRTGSAASPAASRARPRATRSAIRSASTSSRSGRQGVAGPPADDVAPGRAARPVGLQGAAQVDEVGLQRLARGRRTVAVPQRLDDAVGADDVRGSGDQHGEEQAFLGARHRHRAPSSLDTSSGPRTAMRMTRRSPSWQPGSDLPGAARGVLNRPTTARSRAYNRPVLHWCRSRDSPGSTTRRYRSCPLPAPPATPSPSS